MLFEKEIVIDYGSARILCGADYPLYETFFRKAILRGVLPTISWRLFATLPICRICRIRFSTSE